MQSVLVDREVWRLNLELLPRNLQGKAGKEKKNQDCELRNVQSLRSGVVILR